MSSTADAGGVELADRDRRALNERMTVFVEAPGLFSVVGEGSQYLVDLTTGTCECPDSEHRDPEGGCKHIRRVRYVLGARDVPPGEQITGDDHVHEVSVR